MQINIGKILTGLLTFFVAVVEIILGLRFVLKLLAASSNAEFTLTVYDTSEALVSPFEGVFPSFEAANFTLEISTVLAMIVYGIGGFIFIYLARNFEGFSVNPGSRPSGPPAISQNPSQPQMQQPQPMAPQPMPQQPMQQPQPVQQQPMGNPMAQPQIGNQPMGGQPLMGNQPMGNPSIQAGQTQNPTPQPNPMGQPTNFDSGTNNNQSDQNTNMPNAPMGQSGSSNNNS